MNKKGWRDNKMKKLIKSILLATIIFSGALSAGGGDHTAQLRLSGYIPEIVDVQVTPVDNGPFNLREGVEDQVVAEVSLFSNIGKGCTVILQSENDMALASSSGALVPYSLNWESPEGPMQIVSSNNGDIDYQNGSGAVLAQSDGILSADNLELRLNVDDDEVSDIKQYMEFSDQLIITIVSG